VFAPYRLPEEDVKAFLGAMAVIRENLCQTLVPHHPHRDAVRQAVFFIRASGVEGKTLQE
jgi:hypothetical protein